MWHPFLDLVVVGFTATGVLNYTRYWLLRQQGYWILFPVLCAGVLLLLCSSAIEAIVTWLFGLGWLLDWPASYRGPFVQLHAQFALALAVIVPVCANLIWRTQWRRAAGLTGDLIEVLLQDALDANALVEVTLANRKCYIGLPFDSGASTPKDADISLVPFISGYRDERTLSLKMTTFYAGVLREVVQSGQNPFAELQVVIPKDQIMWARKFDMERYAPETEHGVSPAPVDARVTDQRSTPAHEAVSTSGEQ